jgi:hypothetical protein
MNYQRKQNSWYLIDVQRGIFRTPDEEIEVTSKKK